MHFLLNRDADRHVSACFRSGFRTPQAAHSYSTGLFRTFLLGVVCAGCASAPSAPATVEATRNAETHAEPPSTSTSPMSEAAFQHHIDVLCSPELAGRRGGHPGEARAAAYLASQLETSSIPPLNGNAYLWPFPLRGSKAKSANVVGVIEARGANRDQFVILGAHYDHLGQKDDGLYLGADDNASGTAMVLEVARAIAAERETLDRSVIVAFFGAEEMGLLGSWAFVEDPPVSLSKVSLMVNIDMIGRPLLDHPLLIVPKVAMGIRSESSVAILGTSANPDLRAVIDQAFAQQGIKVYGSEDFGDTLRGVIEASSARRSDHYPFEASGVPAVFLSSGANADYHATTDTPENVRVDLLVERAPAVRTLVQTLAALSEARAARVFARQQLGQ